jgi:hypothetical protein
MGTDFLFATPSLLSGAARTLDLAGQFDDYNYSGSPLEADARALLCDLVVTVRDLGAATEAPPVQTPEATKK